MSIFIFGEFNSLNDNNFGIKRLENFNNGEIVYYINESMNRLEKPCCKVVNFTEVNQMLSENKTNEYCNKFLIVTQPGLVTSDGVIDVFDNYTDEELFPDGDYNNRITLEIKQSELLKKFKDSLLIFISEYKINKIRIFTTGGYDTKDSFCEIYCTIDEMFKIIGEQMIIFPEPNSCIYNITI